MDKNEYETMLKVLEIYEDEWKHRDSLTWKIASTLFYAALICTILPFWNNDFNFDRFQLPMIVFPIAGLALSVIFLVVFWSYSARVDSLRRTIARIFEKLPQELQRAEFSESLLGQFPFSKKRLAVWLPLWMFFSLLAVDFFALNILLRPLFKQYTLAIAIISIELFFIIMIILIRMLKNIEKNIGREKTNEH